MSERRSLLSRAWSKVWLRRCASVGPGCTVLGRVWIHGEGKIRLGARVVLDGRRAPIELHAFGGGTIELGDDVRIEGGSSIEAQVRVAVGARTRIAGYCKVIDNHFHPLRGDRYLEKPPSEPVVLGEDVCLEERAVVLPGVMIEPRVHVHAGSVVTRRVPAGSTVSGNPAKITPPK